MKNLSPELSINSKNFVPYIPENAPFTLEQRAYLNGLFAGLFSRAMPHSKNGSGDVQDALSKSLKPLTILFGSQSGTAERLAKKVAAEVSKYGFVPNAIDMSEYQNLNLKEERKLLILTSTYGDGDPPDNAKAFWEFLSSDQAPQLKEVQYSVLGLGDMNYQKFCQCAKNFDQRLESLGASRIYPRVDCDVDHEEPFHGWLNGVLLAFEQNGDTSAKVTSQSIISNGVSHVLVSDEAISKTNLYSKKNPFPARFLTNRKLNAEGSVKDTRHFEISLESSNLTYEVGDALGVWPTNCPSLVNEIIKTLGLDHEESIQNPSGQSISLYDALLHDYEINRVSSSFFKAIVEKSRHPDLAKLLDDSAQDHHDQYLYGRGIIDLILEFPQIKFQVSEFLSLLKPLQPRLYSIASSPKTHPKEVHLTVAVVRYSSFGRQRKGVCSTFLADRVCEKTSAPIYIHTNKAFRLTSDHDRPIIMVGPGTGIAPFRAFLQERRAIGAKGKNWLFFGDQHQATDFLYQKEFQTMIREGVLTHIDTAFSRDQEQKIYVQSRMLEKAKELFAWLQEGAYFYVCGDASRMAKDVDQALHQVIEKAGGLSPEQAKEYVRTLRSQKRYQRDVY